MHILIRIHFNPFNQLNEIHTINSLEIAIYNLVSSQASLSQALSSLVPMNIVAWLYYPKHVSNCPEHKTIPRNC